MPDEPCRCWTGLALPHSGHCCFAHPALDGTAYRRGQAPPCGHWHPEVPRPTINEEATA